MTSAAAPRAPRAITRIVSSPAIVPTTSGSARAIERLGQRLRLAAAGADDDELLDALDVAQELGGGALERGERGLGVRRVGAGPLVGAVAGALHQAEILMSREMVACVASKPRCSRRRRSTSWLWSGFAVDQLEEDGLAARFHVRTDE